MSALNIILCVLVVIVVNTNSMKVMKDAIGFPEVEENQNLKNREDRKPVYLPSMCTENELYYPGDQKDDWICDCRPAYLYHPGSDTCWPAWRQGPCAEGQILVLPPNSPIPTCERNVCLNDGLVPWGTQCERLGSTKPCSHLYPIAAALNVNATTLLVSCVKLSLESRFGSAENVTVPSILCPPGCKRSLDGKCIPE